MSAALAWFTRTPAEPTLTPRFWLLPTAWVLVKTSPVSALGASMWLWAVMVEAVVAWLNTALIVPP